MTGGQRGRARSRRGEQVGAIAIISALMITFVLFPIAALSVDLGNALSRRTDTQTQADYGAFAAANTLTATATNKVGQTVDSDTVAAIVAAMNGNQPQDDARVCWRDDNCVAASELTDADLTNGRVRYVSPCTPSSPSSCHKQDGLQIVAPDNRVNFGFAKILGFDNTTVHGTATVNIFSGGFRVMPMFAVTGCDYGNQTLADPATGLSDDSTVPVLAYDTDVNTTELTADSQVLRNSAGTVVDNLTKDSTGNTLTLTATKWSATRKIGFFRSDDPSTALVETQTVFWLDGDATKTNLNTGTGYTPSPPNPNGARTVQLDIPNAVAAAEGIWWVRVFDGTDAAGTWSDKDEALPITVGKVVLQCASDVGSGNFGTLDFPRSDATSSDDIAINIAIGLEQPLAPTFHKWAKETPSSSGECVEGEHEAIISVHNTLRTGTNCLATITGGLAPNDATSGLVVGADGNPGALTTKNTADDCDPTGSSQERNISIPSYPTFHINDDVLSCFLLDDVTSLQDVVDPDYSDEDPALFHKSIFDSPRFFYVPVFKIQPEFGGSKMYSVVDFRPAFITDEVVAPTTTKGTHTASSNNGIRFHTNKIDQLKVVFFNVNTLPNESDTSLIDFLGVGRRIVRMID